MDITARARPRLLAATLMGTGAALVVHILSGLDLRLGVGAALVLISTAFAWTAIRSPHRGAARTAAWGAGAGLLATIAYDVARVGLAQLDASPYDPFEAIHAFGTLLAGPEAGATARLAVGLGFHFINGVAFGAAFSLLVPRGGVLPGIGWGLGLEAFQLTLYPGWLDIRAYAEFAQISAAGHLVYGASLGWLVARGARGEVPDAS